MSIINFANFEIPIILAPKTENFVVFFFQNIQVKGQKRSVNFICDDESSTKKSKPSSTSTISTALSNADVAVHYTGNHTSILKGK